MCQQLPTRICRHYANATACGLQAGVGTLDVLVLLKHQTFRKTKHAQTLFSEDQAHISDKSFAGNVHGTMSPGETEPTWPDHADPNARQAEARQTPGYPKRMLTW